LDFHRGFRGFGLWGFGWDSQPEPQGPKARDGNPNGQMKKKLGWICAVDSWENKTCLKQQQALRSLFDRMKAKLLNEVGSIRGDSPCHPAGPQTPEPVSINRA